MLYSLGQGADERKLIKGYKSMGLPIPESIRDAPILLPGSIFFFNAFRDLSTCRSSGMSSGPIPWLAIDAWCNANDVHGDARRDVFLFVRTLDNAWMEYHEGERKRKTDKDAQAKRAFGNIKK